MRRSTGSSSRRCTNGACMAEQRVLVTCRQMQGCMDAFEDRFADRGIEVVMPEVVQQPSEDELIEILGEFDGMIAGDDPLTARVLENAGRLSAISKWGVGTDGIDKEAAERLGITVTNTPGVFGGEVADLAIGYIVMLARQLHRIDESVKSGGWLKVEGKSLAGASVGIVGLGDIGLAIVERAKGFSMRTRGSDPSPEACAAAEARGTEAVEFDQLLPSTDFLVLCCPLTESNRHIVSDAALGAMPEGGFVINVARGPLVDETALARSLKSGHTAGAALDVFEEEPLPAASPLRRFPQCVFGSHNGSNTTESNLRASAKAVDNLLEILP